MSNHKVGDILAGKYEIKAILGAGGMGTVYRARQIDLGRDVAIKVPIPSALEIPGFLARFSREARTVARLLHDNIVQVYEFQQSEESVYIVMEFVEGQDLKSLVQVPTPDLTVRDMATILRDSCEGLAHAHENGIVHRDIKPHNIMVQQRGRGKWRVKIMDFGIAHLEENANITMHQEQLTVTGQAIGTPSYMSPEQIRGVGVTGQSDIYSFGCVIFFVFTRQTPFQGTGFTVAAAHLSEAPPRVRARVPALPEEIDGIIQRCLAKDPSLRPVNASDLGQEIYKALEPIFDRKMSEMWPDPSQDGGGTDLIKPTKPLDPAAQSAPTLASTVIPGNVTRTDSPAASQPTMVDPRLKASVDAQPIRPVQHATRTATALVGQGDATMNVGGPLSEAPAPLPPAASGEFYGGPSTPSVPVETPAPSRPPYAMVGGAFALLLLGGVSLGIVMMNREPARTPGGVVAGGAKDPVARPEPTPGIAVLPSPGPGDEPKATEVAVAIIPTPRAEATPARPAATAAPTARPTASPEPTPSPDQVLVRLDEYRRQFAAAVTLEERAGVWRDTDRESDPRLRALASEFALQIALNPELTGFEDRSYTRGSRDSEGEPEDRPAHTVRLSEFSIGRYEVTALEFSAFLNDSDPAISGRFPVGRGPEYNIVVDQATKRFHPAPDRERHPANGVTWEMAMEYAKWLARRSGKKFSLPTEAQWEVAARSGTQNRYPWGSAQPTKELANFSSDGTEPVTARRDGSTEGNVFHMAGNVSEWCLDVYVERAYDNSNERDPAETGEGDRRARRILRGGGYADRDPDLLAATRRFRLDPTEIDPSVGFRIVLNSK